MNEYLQALLAEDDRVNAPVVQKMLEHDEESAFKVTHGSIGLKILRRAVPLARGATVVVTTGLQGEETEIAAQEEACRAKSLARKVQEIPGAPATRVYDPLLSGLPTPIRV